MKCPYCESRNTKVTDKRESEKGLAIRRRRECLRCKKRFTTYERVEQVIITVIKKDGKREPFNRAKIMSGIEKACNKRPVTSEQLEKVVSRIESRLRKKKEVKSSKIGELVLKELKKLDKVAYMRFASVYKEFENLKSFKKEFALLK